MSLVALCFSAKRAHADQTIPIDGTVPDDGLDHFFLPFQVPEGTQEIEILHDDQSADNILDWGLDDPNGYRGWGGGTSENAIVGVNAASRAYVPGPLPAGTWNVVVGKAKIVASPATYHVVVTLRTTPTLPAQTDRKPYAASAPLSNEARWYACDFHVHDRESTDASPSLEDNVKFAESQGLDCMEASDHNTVTQMDYMVDLQAKHPHLLILPGIEWTTYHGHGNAIGATTWVDHKIGQPGVTITNAVDQIHGQGALFAINHPVLDIGNLCIGCAWAYGTDKGWGVLPAANVDAFEIESGGYRQAGFLFTHPALQLWDSMLDTGAHIAAIGGSDDHSGGDDSGQFQSAIGNPTTYVYAENLSVAAILDGIKKGRTFVKMQDAHDPAIDFESQVAPDGDTVHAKSTIFTATITGGNQPGITVHFVHDGDETEEDVPVTSDPFTIRTNAIAPATGEERWRVELLADSRPRTVTSHIFLRYDANGPDPVADEKPKAGCGCRATRKNAPASAFAWIFAGAFALVGVRRLRRRPS